MSNVTLAGFDDAGRIDERFFPDAFGEKEGKGMARLPIEETPVYQNQGKSSASVRHFGTVGNGVNDDSPAIQAAMDSGAAEISFEPAATC